ncbi:MAG: LLM class flavin-dependent oxidoreductase, partial [Actinomycetota bacterium]
MVTASVNIIPEGPIPELVALAVLAERLGYGRCWVYDEGLATRDVYVTLAAIAAATAATAADFSAQMNIQVHGGIGFTWEHDLHL